MGSPSKQQKTEAGNHKLSQRQTGSLTVNIATTNIPPKGIKRNRNIDKHNNDMPAKDNKGKGNPKDDGESCFVAVNVAAKKCPEKATKRNMIDDDKGTPNKEGETNTGIDELHKGAKAAVGIMTFTDDKHNEQAKDDKGNEVTTDDDAKGTGEDDGENKANNPNVLARGTDLVSNIQRFLFWNLQILLLFYIIYSLFPFLFRDIEEYQQQRQ